MIKRIYVENYKIFEKFELDLDSNCNIIVGDNEQGKSTILEIINLALTKRLNGKLIESELTPYIFNATCVSQFIQSVKNGHFLQPPSILIEIYFEEDPDLAALKGSMNSKKDDCSGVKLEISFDQEYSEEYKNLVISKDFKQLPTEYYKVQWHSFANRSLNFRGLPVRASYIDATTIRLQSGTDYYLQDIIKNDLDIKERVELNIAYRNLKEAFSEQESIKGINQRLVSKKGAVTDKNLTIGIDISQKSNWETNLIPHLDDLPFHFIGKGEQSALKIMLALERKVNESNIILIEEPENHLSFSSMNKLVRKITEKCNGKQIIATTHSAYVLNKLGLENLILIYKNAVTKLRNLPADTYNYFKKLSGYDTLRLILAKKAILVEGPSDELIVQKAFFLKHKKSAIEEGVDVINVRGLSACRFLDIAKELKKEVVVVTDNDGDFKNNVDEKFKDYSGFSFIKVCRSEDDSAPTLEPQLLKSNSVVKLNTILGTSHKDDTSLIHYMGNNKTECALKILETKEDIKFPEYIEDAIK